MKVILSAEVPTAYQYSSLSKMMMPITKHGNGQYSAIETFTTKKEARKHLMKIAENCFDGSNWSPEKLKEAKQDIRKNDRMTYDGCTVTMEEIN